MQALLVRMSMYSSQVFMYVYMLRENGLFKLCCAILKAILVEVLRAQNGLACINMIVVIYINLPVTYRLHKGSFLDTVRIHKQELALLSLELEGSAETRSFKIK